MEQAGTMGKRRAVPVHDRSPLDPIFGSGSQNAAFELRNFGLNSQHGYVSSGCHSLPQLQPAPLSSETPH
jgi:hypothetical protein